MWPCGGKKWRENPAYSRLLSKPCLCTTQWESRLAMNLEKYGSVFQLVIMIALFVCPKWCLVKVPCVLFKELKVATLESKMAETECAMTELETTASQQLHGLARQSEQALEVVQKKLVMANEKVEEFITFVKVSFLIIFYLFMIC